MQSKHLFFTITFLLSLLLASFAQEPTLLEHGGGVRTVEFSPVDASCLLRVLVRAILSNYGI